MTREEAKKALEEDLPKVSQFSPKMASAYEVAISALCAEGDNTMEWIQPVDPRFDNSGRWRRKCSKCGYETRSYGHEHFCPNCGRKAVQKNHNE